MDRDVLHKEIDLIQECIKRMAHNSFMLKGWTVSLVAVILALGKDYDFMYLSLILLLPTICFWYLDAFFLRTEKRYRMMYEWVIENRLETDAHAYKLNPHRFKKAVSCEFRIMFSKTLFVFYGIMAAALIVVFIKTSGTLNFVCELLKNLSEKG